MTEWNFISASSSNASVTTNPISTVATPNVGDLLCLSWFGQRTSYTGATPSDTGSGGWASIQPFQTIAGTSQSGQAWWKVAALSDYNGGSGITVSVTGTGGSGAIAEADIEVDVFRLTSGYSPLLDIAATTSSSTGVSSLSASPSVGSAYPSFTDALAWTALYLRQAPTPPGPSGTNTFAGSSAAANLSLCVTPIGGKVFNQYVPNVQSSATPASNLFTNSWGSSPNRDILIGATFVYTPQPPVLAAYYRLGDAIGSFSVLDSSGNAQTGSLIAGQNGTPNFGNAGPFLYDPNTCLDCTAAQNTLNGGFSTTDNSAQPPVAHQPLGNASSWSFECWAKWTSNNTTTTPGKQIGFSGTVLAGALNTIEAVDLGVINLLSVGDAVTGSNIPASTTITSLSYGGQRGLVGMSASATAPVTNGNFIAVGGVVGATLFSAASIPALSNNSVDIRVGATNSASITSFNRITVGTANEGSRIFTVDGFSTNAMGNPLDGAWHHIVITYASEAFDIYFDGAFDSSWMTNGVSWSNPANITFGCGAGATNGWVGWMSDVALYSAVLTPAQILNHYTIGTWFQQLEYGAAQGDTTAGRFNKVMAVVGLDPETMLNVPYPFKTQMYAETNVLTTTSGLNYLQTLTETEPGIIFAAPVGSPGTELEFAL